MNQVKMSAVITKKNEELEKEIDLVDLVRLFVRRKVLFIASLLCFLTLSLVYVLFFYTSKYYYSTYIQPAGYYQGTKFIPTQDLNTLLALSRTIYISTYINMHKKNASLNRETSPQDRLLAKDVQVFPSNNLMKLKILGTLSDQTLCLDLANYLLSTIRQQEQLDFKRQEQILQTQINNTEQFLRIVQEASRNWRKENQHLGALDADFGKFPYADEEGKGHVNNFIFLQYLSNFSKSNQITVLTRFYDFKKQELYFQRQLKGLQISLQSLKPSYFVTSLERSPMPVNISTGLLLMFLVLASGITSFVLVLLVEFFAMSQGK